MKQRAGIKVVPLSFNRKAVIASATVTKEKNVIHSITDVDITIARKFINDHYLATGEKLSLTAYIVTCLARVIKDHPLLNSFIKGNRQIILDDVTVSVLIEREVQGEKVPEPLAVQNAQSKTYRQVNDEIRTVQNLQGKQLGNLSRSTWFKLVPAFLLTTFIRLADRNIRMGKKYGKIAVTALGMFNHDSVWFIPHGSPTVLVTVGGISFKPVVEKQQLIEKEHLCLTVSFDHNIVDGAPASRFLKQFMETIRSGECLALD
jgi:pyruvate/2-oxoglutarate dehydrogenase complex dihydrolipoamide acyltransferase (E2) component